MIIVYMRTTLSPDILQLREMDRYLFTQTDVGGCVNDACNFEAYSDCPHTYSSRGHMATLQLQQRGSWTKDKIISMARLHHQSMDNIQSIIIFCAKKCINAKNKKSLHLIQ